MEKQTYTLSQSTPQFVGSLELKKQYYPSKPSKFPNPRRFQKFQFHPALDTNYLEIFYGSDREQAFMSFNIFLKFTATEFSSLRIMAEQNKWDAFKKFAHKLKPNFKVVGLTGMSKKLERLENIDLKKVGKKRCFKELDLLESQFEHYLPIIIEQKNILSKS